MTAGPQDAVKNIALFCIDPYLQFCHTNYYNIVFPQIINQFFRKTSRDIRHQADMIFLIRGKKSRELIQFCHNQLRQQAETNKSVNVAYNLGYKTDSYYSVGATWEKLFWIIYHRCAFRKK